MTERVHGPELDSLKKEIVAWLKDSPHVRVLLGIYFLEESVLRQSPPPLSPLSLSLTVLL